MNRENVSTDGTMHEEEVLSTDSRWVLVQRILSSDGFRRAEDLRKILAYISRVAILKPGESVRESEIACNVLGRRRDFDPSQDNIVRAQFLNIRKKLDQYFAAEGLAEPVVIQIFKGSYIPVFTARQASPQPSSASEPPGDSVISPVGSTNPLIGEHSWPRSAKFAVGASLTALVLVAAVSFVSWRLGSTHTTGIAASLSPKNSFVELISKVPGPVTVVLPDTSATMIYLATQKGFSASDYAKPDFFKERLQQIRDPLLQSALAESVQMKSTSSTEALVAHDLADTLRTAGVSASLRYARDLHVGDLNNGFVILIGGPSSNPWATLYQPQLQFQFVENHTTRVYYYANPKPLPGELSRYDIMYANGGKGAVGYVDLALTRNALRSGYILTVIGADAQANEAAVKFLLHGDLPKSLQKFFTNPELQPFEVLLKGNHIQGEADDSLEVVAYRPHL